MNPRDPLHPADETNENDTIGNINDTDDADDTGDISKGDEKVVIIPLGEESKKITQTLANDSARQILEALADEPMSASDLAGALEIPLTTVKYNLDSLIESGLITVKKTKWSVKGRKVKVYAPIRKLIVLVPDKTDKKSVVNILKRYLGVVLGAMCLSVMIEWWHQHTRTQWATGGVIEETTKSGIPTLHTPQPMMDGVSSAPPAGTPEIVSRMGGGYVNDTFAEVQEVAVREAEKAVASATPTGTPVPSEMLPVPEPTFAASPITEGAGVSSIDLSQVLGVHPGAWFLFGCLFVVALLVLMEHRRKRD